MQRVGALHQLFALIAMIPKSCKKFQKTFDINHNICHINKALNANQRKSKTHCGCGSVVEHLLAKENVVGSNPITRLQKRDKLA